MALFPPARIALVAHAREVVDDIRAYLKSSPDAASYDMHYQVAGFEDVVRCAKAQLAAGYEVVLCHGGTGNTIVQALGNDVVLIDRTDMDIIHAVMEARSHGQDIVLAIYREEHHDVATMEHLLDVRLHTVRYDNVREMYAGIEDMFSKGVKILVGGGPSSAYMRGLGGHGVVAKLNPFSIRQALLQASAMIRQKRIEQVHQQDLDHIFRYVRDGIVSINSLGELMFANARALKLLKIPAAQKEEHLAPHYEELGLRRALLEMQARPDHIVSMEGESFICSTFPLHFHAGLTGAVAVFNTVSSIQAMNSKIGRAAASGFHAEYGLENILGQSAPMRRLREQIQRMAAPRAAVFIEGETGSGKELAAHALHKLSPRSAGPFVAVNCASISESLMESELFGYDGGSFTGARTSGRAGLFEMANNGSLFLDEIGEISAAMQTRLLRVLEEGCILRLGGSRRIPVNVRIISASNRNLLAEARRGAFRLDLYYRLATLSLRIPPLRERGEDIPVLAERVLAQYDKSSAVLTKDMLRTLAARRWPGNVRELLSFLERYCLHLESDAPNAALFDEILAAFGPDEQYARAKPSAPHEASLPFKDKVSAYKHALALEAMQQRHGDRTAAAHDLGISPASLWRILREGPEHAGCAESL